MKLELEEVPKMHGGGTTSHNLGFISMNLVSIVPNIDDKDNYNSVLGANVVRNQPLRTQ